MVFGIPAEAVTNLCMRTAPVAALVRCSLLDWAYPILVVVDCNVTTVGDPLFTSTGRSVGRSVLSDAAAEGRGRWCC